MLRCSSQGLAFKKDQEPYYSPELPRRLSEAFKHDRYFTPACIAGTTCLFLMGLTAIAKAMRVVPVPGGVLVRDKKGAVIGAVGVTGDTSENDSAAAQVGIESAGFTAEI